MHMACEILIYLFLILSIMFVTWLYIYSDKQYLKYSTNIKDKYIKSKDTKIRVIVNIEGADVEECEMIGQSIAYGNFNNIYDIVDIYTVLMRKKENIN